MSQIQYFLIFGTVWADHVPDPIFSITSLNISCFLLAFSAHAASARQQGLFCINWRDYVTSETTQKKSLKSTFCSSSTSQPPHSKKTFFLHFTSQYRSMISTTKILSLHTMASSVSPPATANLLHTFYTVSQTLFRKNEGRHISWHNLIMFVVCRLSQIHSKKEFEYLWS